MKSRIIKGEEKRRKITEGKIRRGEAEKKIGGGEEERRREMRFAEEKRKRI